MIVKAPMHLKCLASYFDRDNRIDGVKNHNVGQQRNEANKIERTNRQKGLYDYREKDVEQEDQGPQIFIEENEMEKGEKEGEEQRSRRRI